MEEIKVLMGEIPVILSAPHSVAQFREGKTKYQEKGTEEIVENLNKEIKTYGIYKIKEGKNDPNWDEKCEYKDLVEKLVKENNIKLLIDFHGMAEFRTQNICIGTGKGKNIHDRDDLVIRLKEMFEENHIDNVTIDDPFSAEFENTISARIAKNCNIPTIQVEINWRYRKEIDKLREVEDVIKKFVKAIVDSL